MTYISRNRLSNTRLFKRLRWSSNTGSARSSCACTACCGTVFPSRKWDLILMTRGKKVVMTSLSTNIVFASKTFEVILP